MDEVRLTRLKKARFNSLKEGDVVYLRGHVLEKDCPGWKGCPAVYFGNFETLHQNFVRSRYYVIKLNETKAPVLFTKVKGKLIPQPDNNLNYGQEVFLSMVVTKIHEIDENDPWDYRRVYFRTGSSLEDHSKQGLLMCSHTDFQSFVNNNQHANENTTSEI